MLTFEEIVKYSKNILPHCNVPTHQCTKDVKLYLTHDGRIRYYCGLHYKAHYKGKARKLTIQEQFTFKIIENSS